MRTRVARYGGITETRGWSKAPLGPSGSRTPTTLPAPFFADLIRTWSPFVSRRLVERFTAAGAATPGTVQDCQEAAAIWLMEQIAIYDPTCGQPFSHRLVHQMQVSMIDLFRGVMLREMYRTATTT